MNEFIAALRQLLQGLRLWVTVTPWEQALRVRLGKRVSLLNAGVHLKLPLIDMVYLQSVRMRITKLMRQTVASSDGQAVTVSGAVGYSISDIGKLYKTLHHAEDTIISLAAAAIAEHISTNKAAACTPAAVERGLENMLNLSDYGISSVHIYITECTAPRTYRLLGKSTNYGWGTGLTTDQMHDRTSK